MSAIVTKDRGSAILIQVEFKRNTPFGAIEYFDPPTLPTIAILDPQNVEKVAETTMTKKDGQVGKYYYICQTAENWLTGEYKAKCKGGDGTYTDVTTEEKAFKLK
ncbi:MAG: hypothetical protein QY316_00475 [Thermodesulfobacteriota bacterium]|nr:MAG: hypothetical protein QY316_00475 [Thermodesulfobacteriota bacterium]